MQARQAWFYCMYLLCLTGLLGITVTGDAFNAFVFLEISSLSSLCADRARPRSPRAAGCLSVPDHGHDRRDLLCDRHRLALSAHRQPQYRRHRRPARPTLGRSNPARRSSRARVHHRRHQPQAGAVPAARLAAERLCLCAVLGDRVPVGDRDQGRGLSADPLLLLGLRRRDRHSGRCRSAKSSSCCRSRRCSSRRSSRSSRPT